MNGPIRTSPIEKSNAHGVVTRKSCPSLCCLPDLIKEIDGMDHEPVGIELAYMIARYKKIELGLRSKVSPEIALKMVNEYLIGVLWRTRDERNGEAQRRRKDARTY